MREFNINRMNMAKLCLGEQPLRLNKTFYPNLLIQDGYLVDEDGKRIGTKGDMYTKKIMDTILRNGTLDHNPRPHYEDFYENACYDSSSKVLYTQEGEMIPIFDHDQVIEKDNGVEVWTPAHTLSVNEGVECTYDLSRGESPMTTLRPIAFKTSVAEILWIYQKESNDLVVFDEMLKKNTWDSDHEIHNWWKDWALKDSMGEYILNDVGHPTIGSCYGETILRRHMLKKEVIDAIRKNPDGRRNISCLWQVDDFLEPHGLKPCAFLTIWNVRHEWDGKDYLDMTMVQRSSDFATAGCINQVQYVVLQKMVAKELGLEAGTFTWKPVNIQIYDRHIPQTIEMLNRVPVDCQAEIVLNPKIDKFDDFTMDDVKVQDYPREFIKKKNPSLNFPLGI